MRDSKNGTDSPIPEDTTPSEAVEADPGADPVESEAPVAASPDDLGRVPSDLTPEGTEAPLDREEGASEPEELEDDESGEPQVSPQDEAALAAIEAELTEMLESESTPDPYEEMEDLRAELEETKNQHLRLAADFDNYRRRVSGELIDCSARAKAELVGRLLEAVDDLQRVSELDADTATVESLVEGVDLVERKVMRALEEAGVEVVDPVGEPFDPSLMEAVMRVPVEEGGDDGVVHHVLQKGYLFKGILVRPARVAVQMND